jgi:hypothetical protein
MFLVIRNNVSVITKYLGGFVVEQDVEPNALKQVDRENDDEQDLKNKKKVNFHHF